MAIDDLRKNEMMSHLLGALDRGEDIGHYGRLVFAMVARHFISEDEICNYLLGNVTEEEARALYKQVEMHDYNPPRAQRIMEWQAQQAFPICPDRDACNVYRDLKFPDSVYEHIEQFYEEKS